MKTQTKQAKIKEPFQLKAIRWSYPKLERIAPPVAYNIAWNLFFSPIRFKRPTRENQAFETAKISATIVNDKEVKIYEWGIKGNPVAVMIHGWSGRATQFFKFIDPLVKEGYHVVAFDAPAHGLSEGKSTNIKEFYETLTHIKNTIGNIKVGIGHSFGGVSLLYAKKEGLNLDTIIMIGSPTVGEDILSAFRKKINASYRTSLALRKMVVRKFDLDFEEITACELAKKIIIKNHLIIHDKDDLEVPFQNAHSLKSVSPSASLILTTGLGHTRIIRDNMVVERTLNFINRAGK
jgi:esterase/lipase